jgi:hypothetical protein
LTPSRSSSRTASRRSELLLVLLLALPAAGLAGQELSLSLLREGAFVRAAAVFRWDREAELTSTLREGLESRITFTLRAFEKNRGLLALLGDRLLAETTLARSAYYNFLDGTYVVEAADGTRVSYAEVGTLLPGFFSVRGVTVLGARPGRRAGWYVAARVQFEPVRLMPPLTIVSLAGAAATHTTEWVRAEVPPEMPQ